MNQSLNKIAVNVELMTNTPSTLSPSLLSELLDLVRQRCGLGLKKDISAVSKRLTALPEGWHPNGDDTAAIPLGDNAENGYQLLAIEGMQGKFVTEQPWFAGWCSVMVNCSDIAAMGGRPIAVVDAVWCNGDSKTLSELVRGMRDAAEHFGVPIVGGHSNLRASETNLAVSILGHANRLLSSFAAQPGHKIVVAMDFRGEFEQKSLNWNAATSSPAERMRGDLALLPMIAEKELAFACKDISQAGMLGTLTMMLESSGCGAEVNLNDIPKPTLVPWSDWLSAFPSFGYLLTTTEEKLPELLDVFSQRNIHAAAIGEITATKQLWVAQGDERSQFYDLSENGLTGFS
ncbi:MAG: sll0787 family AIR synthase-like protein [Oleibacter sp.]|nr:sll0787 family AIR synthase-like protein [Thalassolituus sp.]